MDFMKKMEKNDGYVLKCCFYAFFCSGMMALMMGSIMPMLRESYGISEAMGGYLISAHSIGNFLVSFFYGMLPRYWGYKRSVMALNVLAWIGFVVMAVTGNYAMLFLAFVFTGIGRGAVSNFNNGTVARVSNSNPLALNLLHCFFALGAFIAPYIVLGFTNLGGSEMWRGATLTLAACGGLSIFMMSRMQLKNDRPDKQDKKLSSMEFMKNPSFILLCAMLFCYMCVETSINGWLVSYFKETGVMSMSYAQVLASLLWLIILFGRLACGIISKKVSVRTLLLAISIGTAVFFAVLLTTQNLVMITICIIGLGFCMAGIAPLINALAGPFYGVYSMAVGMTLVTSYLGAILMPSVVGVIAGKFGFLGGMSSISVMAVTLVVLAVINRVITPKLPTEDVAKAE